MQIISKVSLIVPILLLCVLLFSNSTAQDTVPTDMLDSIDVQMDRTDQYFDSVNFRMESITHRLKKSGEISESDTTFMYAVLEDGEHTIFLTESDGTVLEEISDNNDDEESEEVAMESPLSAFSQDERDNYSFQFVESDDPARIKISFEPADEDFNGFTGIVTLDAETWIPMELQGSPTDMPRFVKEMEMTIAYNLLDNGIIVPGTINVRGRAKVALIISVYFQSIQRFYDFQDVPVSRETELQREDG